jgi:hypothetical protein
MSFPWDGMYGVILEGWEVPQGVRACAAEPFSELRQAELLTQFDSVQLISESDYELVRELGEPRMLLHSPDSARFQGAMHRLVAQPDAFGKLMESV